MRRRLSRRAIVATLAATLAVAAPIAVSAKQPTGCTTGTGMVFRPNPVVSSGNENLTDQKDADYAALNNQRVSVPLVELDGIGLSPRSLGNRRVTRPGTRPTRPTAPGTTPATTTASSRSMAYYWVTKSQLYTRSLGFTGTGLWRPINADQQRVRINQWGVDNSFATDHPKDEMRFGKGGVDDAEDAEVILHELGPPDSLQPIGHVLRDDRGRRDQRGLRRLLGGDRRRVGHGRHARPGLHHGLGFDLVHRRSRALPAAPRRKHDVPGRPGRRGPLRRRDLVAGAVEPAGRSSARRGPTRRSSGPSSTGPGRTCRISRSGSSTRPRPCTARACSPSPRSRSAASSNRQPRGPGRPARI